MFLTPRGNSCLSVGTDRHEDMKFKTEMEKLEMGWLDVKNWKGKLWNFNKLITVLWDEQFWK
jgi:hypothetical protein